MKESGTVIQKCGLNIIKTEQSIHTTLKYFFPFLILFFNFVFKISAHITNVNRVNVVLQCMFWQT